MAVVKKETTFETSFVVERDIEDIAALIKSSAAMGVATAPLNVFFLGEAHNVDFDVRRRREVFEALKDDARIVLAVERTLVAPGAATNVVVEMNDLKSSDDGRNKQIVGFVTEKLEEVAAARTIVFFYGHEHEPHIRKHLLAGLDAKLGVNWTTCLPIETSLKNKLSFFPSLFTTVGKRPVGYCENRGDNYLLKLLEKGYVFAPFNVELYAADQVHSLFSRTIYAVYFKNDTYAAHQRKLVEQDGTAGISIKRINGAYTVVAKVIAPGDVVKAEAGKLDV